MIAEMHSFFLGLAIICGVMLVLLVISIFLPCNDDVDEDWWDRKRPSDDDDQDR